MNGRIYDPKLGRFLQADPFVDGATNTQGFNRYSYVHNNPLIATDPTGFFLDKVFKGLNKVLGDFAPYLSIALLAIPGVGAWAAASWQNAFTFGFWTGGVSTGSYRGALAGGVSGAAFHGLGSKFAASDGLFKQGGLAHIGAHATTGGVIAELQGGSFGHGFISAGLTKGAMGSSNYDYMDGSASAIVSRVTVASIVGGTVSELTGGKFANGATTAAMAQLFNQEASAKRSRDQIRREYLASQKIGAMNIAKARAEFSNILRDREKFGEVLPAISVKSMDDRYQFASEMGKLMAGDFTHFGKHKVTEILRDLALDQGKSRLVRAVGGAWVEDMSGRMPDLGSANSYSPNIVTTHDLIRYYAVQTPWFDKRM